jgi:hypothetical protein
MPKTLGSLSLTRTDSAHNCRRSSRRRKVPEQQPAGRKKKTRDQNASQKVLNLSSEAPRVDSWQRKQLYISTNRRWCAGWMVSSWKLRVKLSGFKTKHSICDDQARYKRGTGDWGGQPGYVTLRVESSARRSSMKHWNERVLMEDERPLGRIVASSGFGTSWSGKLAVIASYKRK